MRTHNTYVKHAVQRFCQLRRQLSQWSILKSTHFRKVIHLPRGLESEQQTKKNKNKNKNMFPQTKKIVCPSICFGFFLPSLAASCCFTEFDIVLWNLPQGRLAGRRFRVCGQGHQQKFLRNLLSSLEIFL